MAEDKNNMHYFLGLSADEDERLKLGQLLILDHMEKAVWAPLDLSVPGLRMLDSATASGVWLHDLKASLPASSNHTYIGTDITPIYFVKNASPDLTLQVKSMKQPWPTEWQGTFDLVHQRMALPTAGRSELLLPSHQRDGWPKLRNPFPLRSHLMIWANWTPGWKRS